MNYQNCRFELRDNVAWITLDRPESLNALNTTMAKELLAIANRCLVDDSIRSVVLTGSGERAFCAGGDVHAFAEDPEHIELLITQITTDLHAAISRFAWMDAPVIAMVNGVAAGAGLSLTACCDLAIAADTARFSSAYTRIGFTPDGSSTYFLPRLIGHRRAAELFLTNRELSAHEALDWGLLNQVVGPEQLRDTVAAVADRLARGSAQAHGGVKRLLMMSSTDSLESQMERETRQLVHASGSPDGREGVRAFVHHRKPAFNGQ
ncbi:enoyl-CoA hydratase/isomerase family protein [Nocardia sp. CNY236]|uniref:enoyl-CoA hydratase/isomerase family protein n=1 Tax=Nocardia sp. CNY236 TaxID=1169152 RepID=UPI0003F6DD64|nr:enoyl-CoA hydratase-related protein [Nocardia sp. CNY236]